MSVDEVCRVCLVNNLNLYGVRNDLQNVYETITREKYNEAGYPVRMCYICLAALRKCHRFMETARDANNSLKQFYNQQCQIIVAKPLINLATKVDTVCIDSEGFSSDYEIKEENVDVAEQLDDCIEADNSGTLEDIKITEVKTEVETIDVTQASHTSDSPQQEGDEGDVCVFENKQPNEEILESNNKTTMHICDICNEHCLSVRSLKLHITRKHRNKDPKKASKTILTGQVYCCDICNFKFTVKSQLARHLKRHRVEKPVKCDHCAFECVQTSELSYHMRKHTGEKPFACDFCSFKSSWRSPLIWHMRTHTGEKPYLCNVCGENFTLKPYLDKHMKSHSGKLIFCDSCSFNTTSKTEFAKHMRTHTGEKPFKCNSCSYETEHKRYLKVHMRVHGGEKPFTCNICGYKCKLNLNRHMRIHTGEKPYSCNLCSYKCSMKFSLNIHTMRRHTGEKPLSCNICGYRCVAKNSLSRHIKQKHTDEKNSVIGNTKPARASRIRNAKGSAQRS